MAITPVTPSANTATMAAASTGNANSIENGAVSLSFGNLFSFQLADIVTTSPHTTGASLTEQTQLSDESVEDPSLGGLGQLFAGMLAITPEVPPRPDGAIHLGLSSGSNTAQSTIHESQLVNLLNGNGKAPDLSTSLAANSDTNLLVGGSSLAANLAAQTTATNDIVPSDFAATLAAQAANHAHTALRHETAARTEVATPINDARWAQDFGEQIVWMAKSDQQSAQISINPPQLGPVQISLKLNGDQASISFASPHAEVRQAIEDAMPRLREVLSGAGIDLGQSNVGAQLAQQQQGQSSQTPDSPRFSSDNAILGESVSRMESRPSATTQVGQGLVDLYA